MMRRPDVWRINGTGNAATDTTRLQAAVTAANAAGKPVLFEFSGSLYLNAVVTITAPVSMRFLPGAELVRTQFSAAINYGTSPTPWLNRTYSVSKNSTVSNLPRRSSTLRAPGLDLAIGDLVAVWSDTAVTAPEITPQVGYEVRYIPMEVHRIERQVTGAERTWTFADFTDDDFLVNPYLAKLTPIRGVRIEGLRARKLPSGQFAAGESASGNFLQFSACEDLELYDCWFTHPTPGALAYRFCYNVRTIGCRLGALESPNTELDTIYGIVEAICNRTITKDCTFDAVRHAYTTGSLQTSYAWASGQAVVSGDYRTHGAVPSTSYTRVWRATGSGTTGSTGPTLTTYTVGATVSDGSVTWEYRGTSQTAGLYLYGTNRNFRVENCTASYNGKQTGDTAWSGSAIYDTHADAHRGVFANNTCILPAGGSDIADNVAFNVRGRKVVIRNNNAQCHPSTRPVAIYGPDAVVSDNVFQGGWRCLVADTGTNPGVANARFTGNRFINFLGPGVHITAGTGHEISGNDFASVGEGVTTTPRIPSMAVYVESLAENGTCRIINNKMPRDSNKMGVGLGDTIAASQVTIAGNVVTGYGQYNQGLRNPIWVSGETVAAGDVRWASGKEYRAKTGGTVQSTKPTHTNAAGTGTTPVDWLYLREMPSAPIVELESRYLAANGVGKYAILHAPAHGRTPADRHKPLSTTWEIWDDADAASVYSGYVLLDTVTEDHLLVATEGDLLEIPGDSISGSYSISGNGRLIYWDLSLGKYVATAPTAGNAAIYYVTNYTGSAATNYVQVRVR